MKKNLAKKNRVNGRRKGHQFEREIAASLRHLFPEARRHLEYQADEANGVDIINTDPFKFQCKRFKKYAPIACLREIKCDPTFGDIPVLVTAGNGEPPVAALDYADFLWLVKKALGNRR